MKSSIIHGLFSAMALSTFPLANCGLAESRDNDGTQFAEHLFLGVARNDSGQYVRLADVKTVVLTDWTRSRPDQSYRKFRIAPIRLLLFPTPFGWPSAQFVIVIGPSSRTTPAEGSGVPRMLSAVLFLTLKDQRSIGQRLDSPGCWRLGTWIDEPGSRSGTGALRDRKIATDGK
jgi:hypothetical protein